MNDDVKNENQIDVSSSSPSDLHMDVSIILYLSLKKLI